jgi:hypothetical protein
MMLVAISALHFIDLQYLTSETCIWRNGPCLIRYLLLEYMYYVMWVYGIMHISFNYFLWSLTHSVYLYGLWNSYMTFTIHAGKLSESRKVNKLEYECTERFIQFWTESQICLVTLIWLVYQYVKAQMSLDKLFFISIMTLTLMKYIMLES